VNAPQGRCYWAVVPFAASEPFRIYAGTEREPFTASTASLVAAVRKGDPQFDAIVPVKARPILVLSERLDPFDDVLALRLRSFDKLSREEQDRVREHEDEGLFHLDPSSFPHLPAENAAIITALVRVPVSAIDTSVELGRVNVTELRVIHERVARAHDLKLDALVLAQAQRLIKSMQAP
jgi:hypothetical protein